MSEITSELADRVLQVVDQGLCAGVGSPTPGNMCVEAAVCYALGERNWDKPSCVDGVLRAFSIRLNDAPWSSNTARAQGMRRLAVAQLGTRGDFDHNAFVTSLVRMTISKVLPKALRSAASLQQEPHKSNLLDAAQQCETEGSSDAAWAAAEAAARTTAGAAVDAAEAAARAADAAADAAAWVADAAARAADAAADAAAWAAADAAADPRSPADVAAAYAAAAAWAAAASDQLLAEFAEEVVQILIAMKTPGSSFLSLTEKEGQK